MNIATHRVEVPFPQAFAGPKSRLFPNALRYSNEHSITIDDLSVRRELRPCQHWQRFYAIYRTFSCLANCRIASSSTAVWLMPRCCASFRSNSLASELIRMLIDFFIKTLYRKLRYKSSRTKKGAFQL